MHKRNLTFLLILLFSIQGCVVYQKPTVSLSQALDKGKVKVTMKDGTSQKYKSVIYQDEAYYGKYFYGSNGWQFEKLDSLNIEAVQIKDRKKSTTRSVLLALGLAPVLLVLGTFIFWSIFGVV